MNPTTHETSRLIDITGAENTLILLAAPGDEATACAGLIAEACARGRPPFVAILGDGAADGSASRAQEHQRRSRAACQHLGLPDDRLLFVGLRQGAFPAAGSHLFKALQAAMAELSWRRDCNVILAPFAAPEMNDTGDAVATWRLASALARDINLPLVANCRISALPGLSARHIWRLNSRHGPTQNEAAAQFLADGLSHESLEFYGRIDCGL